MLTKDSPQRRHPWTRVSWISGSDVDSLDEEEVNEVESITLGRAFGSESTASVANANTVPPPPQVISPGSDENDRQKNSTDSTSSVTLKPFLFGNNEETTTGSGLPFALNTANPTSSSPYGVSPTTATTAADRDILVSQKGHLITPAVADAVAEEDEVTPIKNNKRSTWKSFFGTAANKIQEEEEEKPEEEAAEEEVKEEVIKTLQQTWTDDIAEVVEEPELEDEDAPPRITVFLDMVWDFCIRAEDEFLNLWAKLVSFGVLISAYLREGANSSKLVAQNSIDKLMTSSSSISTSVSLPSSSALLLPAVALLGGGVLARFLCTGPPPPSPTDDLREFVRFEKAHNVVDLQQIDDLNTEAFRTYARSTCVSAPTYEKALRSLDVGLYGVPDNVRQALLAMAIQPEVTQKNSIQDSNSDFVDSGKADAFMAFWSTVYDENAEEDAYKTCVMVTGVALTVAETIAEWTTKTEKVRIGSEPCQCGYVYCEECPVFDVREVKWPVFERRSLSLRKQEELRRWMVDQAIKSAEHLVLDGNSALEDGSTSSAVALNPAAFAWTGQSSGAFFGEESHADRANPRYTSSSTAGDEL